METSKQKASNPSDKANIISKTFMWWLTDLIKYGYKHDLSPNDLCQPPKKDFSEPLGDSIQAAWEKEVQQCKASSTRPSLARVIRREFLPSYMLWGLLVAFQIFIFNSGSPFVLARLLAYFDPDSVMTYEEVHLYSFLLTLFSFFTAIIFNHMMLGQNVIGMRVRIACCSLMYRKIMKLNKHTAGQTAAGQVINLMSNDVTRFDMVSSFLHFLWISPLHAVFVTYLIWQVVGAASLAGTGVIIIQSILFQGVLSGYQAKLRGLIAKRTDTRVRQMSELVNGIQVIKMYAWEVPFEKMIAVARRLEMKLIMKTSLIRGFSVGVMVFTERLTLYATIVLFTLMGGVPRGKIVFSLAQYYNLMQATCSLFFPLALTLLGESMISIRRIEEFLLLEEMDEAPPAISLNGFNHKEPLKMLTITNATASWSSEPITNTLSNVNLSLRKGQFCSIVGPVGAGKSSLLQLLLGELPLRKGTLDLNGLTVSYAAQESWLFVATVKDNILFGQPFEKDRYSKVVRACALLKDFEQFPKGDSTLVGDRGVSLSGGQRARINLARAVYRKADLYLLDDPLSAVDTHVGKHLMKECIEGFLKDKSRILVTHQLHHLREADKIIILKDGKIETEGKFDDVSKNNLFSELLNKDDNENDKDKESKLKIRDFKSSNGSLSAISREKSETMKESISNTGYHDDNDGDSENEPDETEELMAKGTLSSSVFKRYLTAGVSIYILIGTFAVVLLAQVVTSMSDLWLTHWSNVEALRDVTNSSLSNASMIQPLWNNSTDDITSTIINGTHNSTNVLSEYFLVYPTNTSILVWTAFILLCVFFNSIRGMAFMWVCAKASIGLHDKMFSNVLHATMRFFDTNPSGRILNRFSKDMGTTDEFLPRGMLDALQMIMVLFSVLIMVMIVNPYMLISAVAVGGVLYGMSIVYLKTAQDIKRIEGVTRSPVFSHVTSTLSGLSTVRASNAQLMLQKQFDEHQNLHTSAWFISLAAGNAFGIWNSLMCCGFVTTVIYSCLLLDDGTTRSGDVGLAISQSLTLVLMIQYGLRQITDVISQMTSVERILQYTNLPKEQQLESPPGQAPPPNWPSQGKVVFSNMYLRYYEGADPVLKNLNLAIESGWKVGVVGRTGAGKSSLISALFRLALVDGDIYIDNIDTRKIGLKDLRHKLSIIPQEPVLFSASLRYNLDPFRIHSDAAIWTALENVELKDSISTLSQEVTEGGSNFSAGQRQLLCLARAALNQNKVLILDEATANVDPKTDALIQRSIRSRFADCTVLTVAHRLHTVADSDRVLVMDFGQAVQYNHPHVLLKDSNGIFAQMVAQLGPVAEVGLQEIAKEAYQRHITTFGNNTSKNDKLD